MRVRVSPRAQKFINMFKLKSFGNDFVWTPELAYIIGLLVTDGCLSKDGRHIIMRSSEKSLLKTFKKCLKIKNKIGKTKKGKIVSYRIQFGNTQFYNWLLKIGLTPAKTYTINKIKIPELYFKDFLRGHLDGDGNILFYKDHYNFYKGRNYNNQRVFVRFISASKKHLNWLRQEIIKLVGVKGAFIMNRPKSMNRVFMYEIKFAKKESIKLLKWIYYKKDIPCLKRKRNIAERAIKMILKEKRRKYKFVK